MALEGEKIDKKINEAFYNKDFVQLWTFSFKYFAPYVSLTFGGWSVMITQ